MFNDFLHRILKEMESSGPGSSRGPNGAVWAWELQRSKFHDFLNRSLKEMEPSGPGSSRGPNSMFFLIESLRKWSCLGLGAQKINLMTLLKDSVKNNVATLVMKRSSEWKAPIVRNYWFS